MALSLLVQVAQPASFDQIVWTPMPQTWAGNAVYVDSDNGNDGTGTVDSSGAPNGSPNAYLTVTAAITALETARGTLTTPGEDRVFLKAGTTADYGTLRGGSAKWRLEGGPTSATPLIITSYGSGGVRPRILVGTNGRGILMNLGSGSPDNFSNIVMCGLEFWGGASFDGSQNCIGVELLNRNVTDFIVEDCVFRDLVAATNIIPTGGYTHTRLKLRACQVYDCDKSTGHTNGIYWEDSTDSLTEWCMLHNNGTGSNTSHNIYKSGDDQINYTGRFNITAEPNGTDGHKYRPGGTSRYELFLKCPIGIVMGDGPPYAGSSLGLDARYGVMLDSMAQPDGPVNLGWGVRIVGASASAGPSLIRDMIFAHNTSHRNTNGNALLSGPDAGSEGVHEVEVYDCIWNDWGAGIRLQSSVGATTGNVWDDFKFSRNYLINSVDELTPLFEIVQSSSEAGVIEFDDNTLWWDAAESGAIVNGSVDRTVAQFVSDLGIGTGNAFSDPRASWPDPDRTIATWMSSIGGTASLAGFIAACKTQGRPDLGRTWNVNYTAPKVIEYIRAGYGLAYA